MCICGIRKRKIKKNGELGKTCGTPSCAGKSARRNMEEILKTKNVCPTVIHPRQYFPYRHP